MVPDRAYECSFDLIRTIQQFYKYLTPVNIPYL